MLEADYLMKMILSLAKAIVHVIEEDEHGKDPQGSADQVENLIGASTPIDGETFLELSPESMVHVLQASGSEHANAEFIGRSLYVEADYLSQAGNKDKALLRLYQAQKIAEAFRFDLHEQADASSSFVSYASTLSSSDQA